jgi:hypothetical protein
MPIITCTYCPFENDVCSCIVLGDREEEDTADLPMIGITRLRLKQAPLTPSHLHNRKQEWRQRQWRVQTAEGICSVSAIVYAPDIEEAIELFAAWLANCKQLYILTFAEFNELPEVEQVDSDTIYTESGYLKASQTMIQEVPS